MQCQKSCADCLTACGRAVTVNVIIGGNLASIGAFWMVGGRAGRARPGDRMKSDYMMCGRVAVSRVRFASMTMKIGRLRGFLLGSVAALLLLCASPGKAQTFRGTILGTVTDSSGAAVSGAKETVKNMDTGLSRRVTTTDDGRYA